MGNQQTRKRPAVRDEDYGFVPLKRRRLDMDRGLDCCISSPSTSKRRTEGDSWFAFPKRIRFEGIPNSLHRTSKLRKTTADQRLNRCKSLEEDLPQQLEENCAASCSSVHRSEYPVPWLEALFLPEFPSKSIVNEKCFVILNEIGSGSFGRVYRAIAKHDERGVYAIKIQEKSKVLVRNAVLQVKREASLLRLLPSHVFISRLYATWQSRTKLFSVLQYPVGGMGDLFTVWKEYGNFDEETLRIYGAELACALDFIHRNGVIYRDLKLENVILDAEAHIQIIDFGLAKQLVDGQTTNTICGTLQYMSPSVASGGGYNHSVDWWSYAVLLHILFTGRYPYPNAEATHHTQLTFIDYSTPPTCSSELGNLLDRMLCSQECRRLCCFTVLHAHPFFQSIDFENVEKRMYNPGERLRGLAEPQVETEEKSNTDGEEVFSAFDEEYEFSDFAYFNDNL